MKRLLFSLLALPALLPAHEASAATFRCGSALVSEGDRAVEVQRKCGDPVSRNLIGYSETRSGRQEMQVEEWVYGPVNGMYYYLDFIGGRLNSVESKRD
ncbi:DUF2845 domain-containing protein [Pseudomonas tohonis]|uniref:DUF2845 domain-containing protein n=1 Tax=Pseudomonas tohonis TaxID=2725477 RepID=UPI001F3B6C8E|nr:DUF2845 domain-containing protein [Pseudomonas tohonis]